jgi:uncharacterized membrane protein HdeD (DUF308 family)
MLSNLVLGILAAAVSANTPTKRLWVCWLGVAAGAWVAFSSYFQFSAAGESYLWSNVISGVLIFIAGSMILNSDPIEKNTKTPAHGS